MKSIFLSHNSEDKEFVRELHGFLKENGIKSWIDEAEIKIGDSLLGKINEGINKADYLAIILSPKSVKSNWVKYELDKAMNMEINQGKTKVLPILIENYEIPSCISHKKWGDFRTPPKVISGLKELLEKLKEDEKNRLTKRINPTILKKESPLPKIDIKKLKEITEYAQATFGGMNLSSHDAAQFGIDWCKYYAKYDFNEFKKLFDYAHSTFGGLNLSPLYAKNWALNAIKNTKYN